MLMIHQNDTFVFVRSCRCIWVEITICIYFNWCVFNFKSISNLLSLCI